MARDGGDGHSVGMVDAVRLGGGVSLEDAMVPNVIMARVFPNLPSRTEIKFS